MPKTSRTPVFSGPCTARRIDSDHAIQASVRERVDNFPARALAAAQPFELTVARLGVMVRKHWERGRILSLALQGFTAAQRREGFGFLEAGWCASANVGFREAPWDQAELRFTQDPNGGNYSAIGTDALLFPEGGPTGNIGQHTRGIWLHEFGHALGFPHGQQLPDFNVPLNWPYLIAWARQTQGWDEATLRAQYERIPPSEVEFSPVNDLTSIMQYWIEPEWTLDGTSVPSNEDLSAEDRVFEARVYGPRDPGPVSPPPGPTTPPSPPPVPVPADDIPALRWARATILPYRSGGVVQVVLPELTRQTKVTLRVEDDLPLASPIVDVFPQGGDAVRLPMRPYRRDVERAQFVAGPGRYEARIQFRGGSPQRFSVTVSRG